MLFTTSISQQVGAPTRVSLARSKRVNIMCSHQTNSDGNINRRRSLLLASIPSVLLLSNVENALAFGKSARDLVKEKEARKAKLAESAAKLRQQAAKPEPPKQTPPPAEEEASSSGEEAAAAPSDASDE